MRTSRINQSVPNVHPARDPDRAHHQSPSTALQMHTKEKTRMHTRITSMLGAAALVAAAAGQTFAASCGDVNNDGSVAINDVSIHLRVVSGIDSAAGICGGSGYANCANLNG